MVELKVELYYTAFAFTHFSTYMASYSKKPAINYAKKILKLVINILLY